MILRTSDRVYRNAIDEETERFLGSTRMFTNRASAISTEEKKAQRHGQVFRHSLYATRSVAHRNRIELPVGRPLCNAHSHVDALEPYSQSSTVFPRWSVCPSDLDATCILRQGSSGKSVRAGAAKRTSQRACQAPSVPGRGLEYEEEVRCKFLGELIFRRRRMPTLNISLPSDPKRLVDALRATPLAIVNLNQN